MNPTDKDNFIHELMQIAKDKGLVLHIFYNPIYLDEAICFHFQANSFVHLCSDSVRFIPGVNSEEWLFNELNRVADKFLKEEIE